jgi:hypothetical protein
MVIEPEQDWQRAAARSRRTRGGIRGGRAGNMLGS